MPGFQRRLQDIFRAHRHTILADPDHGHLEETLGLLSTRPFLLAAKNADVRTLFLEIPKELQPDFDDFAERCAAARFRKAQLKSARLEFVAAMKAVFALNFMTGAQAGRTLERIAEIVRLCARQGIRVIAVDEETAEEKRATRQVMGFSSVERIGEFVASHSADDVARALGDIDERIARIRLSPEENARIAHTIAEITRRRGGRAVGLYGILHAPALKAAFDAGPGAAAIVGVHIDAHDYERNVAAYAGNDTFLDITAFDNIALDTMTFLPLGG